MLSGGELNQVPRPTKFGAVASLAATVIGAGVCAVSAAIADVAAPPRHSARTERQASKRGVMAGLPGGEQVSGSEADMAGGIERCEPRHDQRVVLEIGGEREADHDEAEALLQARRNACDAA